MIGPLSRHFHVVAPSIPGYAWSEPPNHRGHTIVETARDYHILLLKLGYPKYNVHGGDCGFTPNLPKYPDKITILPAHAHAQYVYSLPI
jgi:hypothetical protein